MKHVTDRIAAWLAGELSDAEARQVTEHFRDCPACAQAAEAERNLWKVVDQVAELNLSKTSVWPQVQSRTFGHRGAGAWFFGNRVWTRNALASLAVAAGLVVGLVLPGLGEREYTESPDIAVANSESFGFGNSSWLSTETSDELGDIWLAAGRDTEGDES